MYPREGNTPFYPSCIMPQLLVIEDDPVDLEIVRRSLRGDSQAYQVMAAGTLQAGISALQNAEFDTVLTDLSLPDSHGISSVDRLLEVCHSTPVVVLTGTDDELMAIDAVRHGVQDYLLKDEITPSSLKRAIRHARERFELMAQVEAASRAKTDFLANMSHEIRTPLSAILGFTQVLEESYVTLTEAERNEHFQTIQQSGQHLLQLVNDVLDLSKIEAEKSGIDHSAVPVVEMVKQVVAMLEDRCESKDVKVIAEVTEETPEWVHIDQRRLRQILINLIGNAAKFTTEGSITLRLKSQPSELIDHHELTFEVQDTGIGIPADQLNLLWAPFHQVDASAQRRFGGAGLGLTISRKLADLMGGTMEVRSTPGEGSCFSLGLTALQAEPPQQDETISRGVAEEDSEHLNGLRVLLAEDTPTNQRLIKYHLKKLGIETTLVENGQQAVDLLLSNGEPVNPEAFDAVLLDMQMPVLDGYAAARILKGAGCPLPLIALTAHAMEGAREDCLEAGCDDFMTKPIERDLLAEKLVQWTRVATSASVE